jgi:hypothetical protein
VSSGAAVPPWPVLSSLRNPNRPTNPLGVSPARTRRSNALHPRLRGGAPCADPGPVCQPQWLAGRGYTTFFKRFKFSENVYSVQFLVKCIEKCRNILKMWNLFC